MHEWCGFTGETVSASFGGRTRTIRYDTIRDAIINVRSKANMSQLNLPHGTDNQNV